MSLSNVHQNIYVELDAVLDTRFGTLWRMDPAAAEEMLYKSYHRRLLDNFAQIDSRIDHAEYLALYAARNVETLKASRITNLVYLINRISLDLEDDSLRGPRIDGIEVTVNIYPYDLSELEIVALKDSIATLLGPMTGVSIVNHSIAELTPSVIKDSYSALILYHFRDWIEQLDGAALQACPFPRIRIIAPAIYKDTIPTAKDLVDEQRKPIDPFAVMEMETLQFFSLVMTDIRYFSIIEAA